MANGINSVRIKGDGIRHAAVGSGAITPGHLIEIINSSGVLKVRVHSTALGAANHMVALENSLVGKDLNAAYADADFVQYEVMPAGSEMNLLVAAGAPAIVIGDKIESAGDGTVRKHVVTDDVDPVLYSLVGVAMEALDNSGGGAAARLRVMFQ